MMKNIRRICAVLLILAMALTILPASALASAEKADVPSEKNESEAYVIPEEAYASADALFEEIDAVEEQLATKNASQAEISKAAAQLVKESDSYVEGSLEMNGEAFSWWTEDGIRCMYNPRMEKIHSEMVPAKGGGQDLIVNEPDETKAGTSTSKQVYLVAPYYGYDSNFTNQYKNEATRIAAGIGDTNGYTLYSGSAATVDKVATAMSKGAVVIFDSHGTTDYSYGDDCVSGATSSYLCLTSSSGLTNADYNDGAGYLSGGGAAVNGETIVNHMTSNSPSGLLWMAICLSMATDKLAAPLRRMGVEVAYGYSQSVTFGGEYLYEEAFWDKMLEGKNVSQSISYMKSVWGNWDSSSQIGNHYGWPSSYIAYNITEARNEYCAFPIVVSDEDAHPGQRNRSGFYGACSLQNVQSTYYLVGNGPCSHSYDNACDATCNLCGATRPVSGHSYSYTSLNDTYHKRTCTICGTSNQVEHRWQPGTILQQPTETTPGRREFNCPDCGATKVDTISATSIGDLDGSGRINEDDAIYLLQSILMPDMFPLDQDCDYDFNGLINEDDAIYLLQHVLMPDSFPLIVPGPDGVIVGTVASADSRVGISGATIEIRKARNQELVESVRSDSSGSYTASIPNNTYKVKISAAGYIPFESLEVVASNQTIYMETYLMVAGDPNSTSSISGTITNSMTGSGISGVNLSIRRGWNTLTGSVVASAQTDSNGNYSVYNLPLGNYTVAMSCNGFVSGHFNVAVTQNPNNECHGVMTPDGTGSVELGDMRIVLTWGSSPSDLDSHLWGPTADGRESYHIYYSNKTYYVDGDRMAYLDVDDTSAYGPETTTIYDMTSNGTYSFYVHNYSNKSSTTSTAMSNSGAKVKVYMGQNLIAQYNIPTGRVGTVWHVFDFDARTGRITAVNEFSNNSSPSNVGYRNNALVALPAKEEEKNY